MAASESGWYVVSSQKFIHVRPTGASPICRRLQGTPSPRRTFSLGVPFFLPPGCGAEKGRNLPRRAQATDWGWSSRSLGVPGKKQDKGGRGGRRCKSVGGRWLSEGRGGLGWVGVHVATRN